LPIIGEKGKSAAGRAAVKFGNTLYSNNFSLEQIYDA
jgi:hypothetical protein